MPRSASKTHGFASATASAMEAVNSRMLKRCTPGAKFVITASQMNA